MNKQIRFCRLRGSFGAFSNGGEFDIYMGPLYETTQEYWSYAELDDLIQAFEKAACSFIGSDGRCVRGCIELLPDNLYDESDDDGKDDNSTPEG